MADPADEDRTAASHREASPGPVDTLWIVFDAIASAIARVRHDIVGWLKDLRWPTDAARDIVLAIYEALANVADHAYSGEGSGAPGQVQLHVWQIADAATQQRRIMASVTDRGRWKPPTPPGQSAVASPEPSLRGRGLMMMAACMRHVDVQSDAYGTTVTLTSHDAPMPVLSQ